MSKKNKHKQKKKRRKWPWITLLCLIILAGLFRLSLLTGPVHQLVKNKIITTTNEYLKPKLKIGNLSGDLWNGFTLTDITLTRDSTIATIDTLRIKYNLLSYFGDTFKIDKIEAIHPVLKLRYLQNNTWNVEHWVNLTSDTSSTSNIGYKIQNFTIKHGKIHVSGIAFQQNFSFVIDDLNFAGNHILYSDNHFKAEIDTLRFMVKHTRLDSPATVSAKAAVSDSSFSLPKLTITTAHSSLSTSGKLNLTNITGHLSVDAHPFGWKDIAAYIKDLSIRNDLNMSLRLQIGKKQANVQLNADATGVKDFLVKAGFQREPTLALTSLKMSADEIDLKKLLGGTTAQRLQNFELKASGHVPVTNYKTGHLSGSLSAKNIRQGSYQLDALHGTFSFNKKLASIRLVPVKKGQHIIAEAKIHHVWSESPSVFASVKGSHINPAIWMQNNTYKGRLNFTGQISGEGWFPGNKLWSYQLVVNNSKLMGQSLNQAVISGRFNQHKFTTQSTVSISSGRFHLIAKAHNLQQVPKFSYSLNIHHLNLADITGFDEYPSDINGTFRGHGRGNSLQNLQLKTSVTIDSSTLKKEPIKNFILWHR